MNLLFLLTNNRSKPEKVLIPFVLANNAITVGNSVSIVLQMEAVELAKIGEPEKVAMEIFPPLNQLWESFLGKGGKLLVCNPCLRYRRLTTSELDSRVIVVGGTTLVNLISSCDKVIVY